MEFVKVVDGGAIHSLAFRPDSHQIFMLATSSDKLMRVIEVSEKGDLSSEIVTIPAYHRFASS